MADKPTILGPDGRPVASRAYKGVTGYGRGGISNPTSGLGGPHDKAAGSFFQPTRIYWRTPLEILRVQSWAAGKAIDMPVDDMFLRWREWSDEAVDGAGEAMADAEQRHNVTGNIAEGMKAGSAYGTACVVMATVEAPLTEPLIIERIRPGDLRGLHVFDRYDMSVMSRETDLFSPDFQRPAMYRVTPRLGATQFYVHPSRVLRFDGIAPYGTGGFTSYYDQDWGVSELIPILTSLIEDQTLASSIAHLSQEASVPVLKIGHLAEKAAGMAVDPDEQSIEELGQRINDMKSNFHLMLLDKETEDFTRVAVTFQGLANLMDRFAARIAMARDIPQTRFNGNPPTGMSATGESDMRNYVMMVEARRVVRLAQPLPRLDAVLARDAGLAEPPPYRWLSLIELSEADLAEAAKTLMEAYALALASTVVTEDEVRAQLDGHPVFGALPPIDLEALKPDPEPEPAPFGGDVPDPEPGEGAE